MDPESTASGSRPDGGTEGPFRPDEDLAGKMAELAQAFVADALVDHLAARLGSYVGESTRLCSGGEWGWVAAPDGARRQAIRDGSGAVSCPVELARERIEAHQGRLEALARIDRMFGRH
jgi:hypothetical protein